MWFSPRRFCPVMAVTLPFGTDSEISSKMTSLRILFESPAVFKTAGFSSNTEGAGRLFPSCGERSPMPKMSASGRRSKSRGAYSAAILPSRRYKNRSAIPISQSIRCSVRSRVKPCSLSCRRVCASCLVPAASRLAVGSFAHKGLWLHSIYGRNWAARFFSPLERMSTALSFKWDSFNALWRRPFSPVSPGRTGRNSRRERPPLRQAQRKRTGFWGPEKTLPTKRPISHVESLDMSLPSIRTLPLKTPG